MKLDVGFVESFNDDEMTVLAGGGALKDLWDFLKDVVTTGQGNLGCPPMNHNCSRANCNCSQGNTRCNVHS